MKRVKIADLKANLSALLKGVEAGEALEVVHRDRPVARIVPLAAGRDAVTVVPAKRPFRDLRRRRHAPSRWSLRSLDLLLEERGER